jgi:bla regulator protein blaR1
MGAAFIAHLWQSTLCVIVAWMLALALRRHAAQIRYFVWLAASLKFLIPFSALTALGMTLRPAQWLRVDLIPEPVLTAASSLAHSPFSAPALIASAANDSAQFSNLSFLLTVIWAFGAVAVLLGWFRQWWRVRAAVQAAEPMSINVPVEARTSEDFAEPGIFGVFKPVLLLPKDLVSRMSTAELEAVVAHEMCHVERRDNLTAAAHRVVTALFWFNPLVWWIGKRLLEERERACDEGVIEEGTAPCVYAEGILKACHVSLASRLSVVAGASSFNLKHRIEEIVGARRKERLGPWGVISLSTAVAAVLLLPVSVGMTTPRLPDVLLNQFAPARFETFAVSRTESNSRMPQRLSLERGRLSMRNTSLRQLISVAYGTVESRILGGPYWLDDHYDIDATGSVSLGEGAEFAQRRMILALLAERFELKFVEFDMGVSD